MSLTYNERVQIARDIRTVMKDEIERQKEEAEERRCREGLAEYGYDDKMLEGVNLAGLQALWEELLKGIPPIAWQNSAKDHTLALIKRNAKLAQDSAALGESFGIPSPRKL